MVYDELKVRGIPEEIGGFLKNNIVNIESCDKTRLLETRYRLLSLDAGELEAICIIDQCKDRTFKNYLFLTDDSKAQKESGMLGMNSLDVTMFLFASNKSGFLSKDETKDALEALESSGYHISGTVKADYLRRLQ